MRKNSFVKSALCFFLCLFSWTFLSLSAQDLSNRDKGAFKDHGTSYYKGTILESIKGDKEDEKASKPRFKIDLEGKVLPNDPEPYTKIWHNSPISQGRTGTCWCFSTTSFYESEIHRLTGKKVKLSEMFTVYWEYVERARYYVQQRGDMYFGEGSETNAVARMMNKYGIVPWEDYSGLKPGQEFPDHSRMFEELDAFLKSIKERNAWNEEEAVATTKAILNHYLGEPPVAVTVNGKKLSPKDYMEKELKIKIEDYVDFMSLMASPYYKQADYDVPDNWWGSNVWHNLPLNDFMEALKSSLDKGYSIAIGGDVSEAGFESWKNVAVVPSFDIPSEYIDESARQFRFENGSTTDDHAMHVVGHREVDGDTWFLVKDSGSGSRNCGESSKCFGYYFFHEDFVKLKMMNFTVHKSAVQQYLKKFNKI